MSAAAPGALPAWRGHSKMKFPGASPALVAGVRDRRAFERPPPQPYLCAAAHRRVRDCQPVAARRCALLVVLIAVWSSALAFEVADRRLRASASCHLFRSFRFKWRASSGPRMSVADAGALSNSLEVDLSEVESDGEEVLSQLAAAAAEAVSSGAFRNWQAQQQQLALTPKQERGLERLEAAMGRRSNATITTPRGGKQAAAAAVPEPAAAAGGRTTRAASKAMKLAAAAGTTVKAVVAKLGGGSKGRKRKGDDKGEQENCAYNADAAAAAELPAKRRRQGAAAPEPAAAPAGPEAQPAAGGSGRNAGSSRKPRAPQQDIEQKAAMASAPPARQEPFQLDAVMQASQVGSASSGSKGGVGLPWLTGMAGGSCCTLP